MEHLFSYPVTDDAGWASHELQCRVIVGIEDGDWFLEDIAILEWRGGSERWRIVGPHDPIGIRLRAHVNAVEASKIMARLADEHTLPDPDAEHRLLMSELV